MVSKRSVVPKSPRRTQVANACVACRASKVKCSGKHPECSRCIARGIECNFEVSAEGITKRQHLRNELAHLAGQKQGLERANAVIDVLQHGSDSEAVEMLVCLRIGHTVDAAYDHIQNKRSGKPSDLPDTVLSSSLASTSDTNLPRSSCQVDNKTVQSLPNSTTIPQTPCWPFPQLPISNTPSISRPTVTSDRPHTWPYPPMSNDTQSSQQDNRSSAYTYQHAEDDSQIHQFGLVTPISPLSTCSSSRQSNAQDSYIQQPYSREHLFFESTPRDVINPSMFNNPS
ncbi:hypothetical protein DOTSEDRAFT_88426 [Dothistroma septosporum NZE10]|uniref:Zn(2)-C6 fungal-type domain-containing protein n=1 Tax=Dothistroma septosporum (strain NZE10 / CBS 128990) TaxID=675120 RepID=N1PP20_DOTSN|nr:hypothetical protein DOTSEDRAFT_88426 [Dothistroma septosporum NZE10]